MARVKGSKNRAKTVNPKSPDEFLHILANLIIDRIFEEQQLGRLNQIIKSPIPNG